MRSNGHYTLECVPGEGTCDCSSPGSRLSTVDAPDLLPSPVWSPYLAFTVSSVSTQMGRRLAMGPHKAQKQAPGVMVPPP